MVQCGEVFICGVFLHVCVFMCQYVHLVCVCLNMYMCFCVCVHVCIYVHVSCVSQCVHVLCVSACTCVLYVDVLCVCSCALCMYKCFVCVCHYVHVLCVCVHVCMYTCFVCVNSLPVCTQILLLLWHTSASFSSSDLRVFLLSAWHCRDLVVSECHAVFAWEELLPLRCWAGPALVLWVADLGPSPAQLCCTGAQVHLDGLSSPESCDFDVTVLLVSMECGAVPCLLRHLSSSRMITCDLDTPFSIKLLEVVPGRTHFPPHVSTFEGRKHCELRGSTPSLP